MKYQTKQRWQRKANYKTCCPFTAHKLAPCTTTHRLALRTTTNTTTNHMEVLPSAASMCQWPRCVIVVTRLFMGVLKPYNLFYILFDYQKEWKMLLTIIVKFIMFYTKSVILRKFIASCPPKFCDEGMSKRVWYFNYISSTIVVYFILYIYFLNIWTIEISIENSKKKSIELQGFWNLFPLTFIHYYNLWTSFSFFFFNRRILII